MKILWVLDIAREGATVQEIADAVHGSYQNVSKHLGTLFGAGIVSRYRDGTSMRYVLRDWTALWVIDRMTDSVGAQLEEDHDEFAASS